MPILPVEPQIAPERMFELDREIFAGLDWWLLHTKPRQEKSLSRQLSSFGIAFYLPLVQKRFRVRNRTVTSHLPLFAGYVFLLAEPAQRLAALSTQRIVRAIPVANQYDLWRDLTQIHRLISTGAPITPEDRLAPGAIVEIGSGPLRGLRGKILEGASRRRFVVEVDFIHRGASIVLDDDALIPVPA